MNPCALLWQYIQLDLDLEPTPATHDRKSIMVWNEDIWEIQKR